MMQNNMKNTQQDLVKGQIVLHTQTALKKPLEQIYQYLIVIEQNQD